MSPLPEHKTLLAMLKRPVATVVVVAAIALAGAAISRSCSPKVTGGDSVEVRDRTVNAPSQFGGRANTLNVNQPAVFKRKVAVELSVREDLHHAVVTFSPTVGMWQPGETFGFRIRLREPCLRWTTPGQYQGPLISFGISPQETDVVVLETTTPPKPGTDVVFDIVDDAPIEVLGMEVSPTEPSSVPGS